MSLKKFAVLDIETRGLSARPEAFVFACIYADNYERYFYDREELRKFLISNNNPFNIIYAHNGEFDFTCIFDNIILYLDNEALFVGSTFISAKCNGKMFANSLTILKSGVDALGKCLGLEKGKIDEKFIRGDKKIVVNDDDRKYCKRDCEIVYHYLTLMFEMTGKIKPTVASCAMQIFRTKYLQRKFIKNPLNEKFRHSYYGGRVECFRFGKIKPVYKYDKNSLYPASVVKMFFPDFNKLKQGKKCNVSYFEKNILPNYEGCAYVTIEHKENFVGVLPFRRSFEIIFPYGIFSAWYNFNELRYALTTGLVKIKQIKEFVYAPRMQFTELTNYMLDFFNLKNTSEGAEQLLNKFLLNSLTGKFAQKDYGKKIYFEKSVKMFEYVRELPEGTKYICHHFSEERDDYFLEVFNKQENDKNTWKISGISSYITSEARIMMLPFYLKYQNNLCYTDTDSIALTCKMDEKYISSTILGMFKKEDETEMDIIGNKHYKAVKNKKRSHYIKGVSKKYRTLTLKEYNAILLKDGKEQILRKGNSDFLGFNKMTKTKEAISRNKDAGEFTEVVKHLANDYTKRTVSKNHKTKTIKLNEN